MCKRILSVVLLLAVLCGCLPMFAVAAGEKSCTLEVESTYAAPDATVNVNINIKNNPGILGATLSVSWDEGITLTDSANGVAFSSLTLTKPSRYISGCNFVWYGNSVEEPVDGTVLTLTFKVSEDAVDADHFAISLRL